MDDIESIERATLAAVPPQRLEQWGGWLLAFDDGTVGRCHSAVPLRHEAPPPGVLAGIERRYAAAGLPAVLRGPELAAGDGLRAAPGRARIDQGSGEVERGDVVSFDPRGRDCLRAQEQRADRFEAGDRRAFVEGADRGLCVLGEPGRVEPDRRYEHGDRVRHERPVAEGCARSAATHGAGVAFPDTLDRPRHRARPSFRSSD